MCAKAKKHEHSNKCIIYARQSQGKEENSASIEMQIAKCKEYAEKKGYEILGIFSDPNTSGRLYPDSECHSALGDTAYINWLKTQTKDKRERKGLAEAIKLFPQADILLVDDPTRLGRPATGSYLGTYLRQLLSDNDLIFDTVKNGLIDIKNLAVVLAQMIGEHISSTQIEIQTQKSKDAMKLIKDSGYYPTMPRMFGIKYIGGEDRKVEVIPECAEVVRFIFSELNKATSYNKIVQMVNQKYIGLFDGKAFYDSTFRHIASQPFYAGYMYNSKKELIPAKQMQGQEVISFTEWKNAQDVMNKKHVAVHRERKRILPFSGMLVCPSCAAKLVVGNDNGKLFYYCAAGSNALQNPGCRKARINITLVRESDLYTGLYDAVYPLLILAQFIIQKRNLENKKDVAQLDKMRAKYAQIESKIASVVDSFVNMGMSQATMEKTLRTHNNNLVELRNKITIAEAWEQEDKKQKDLLKEVEVSAKMINNKELSEEQYKALVWETFNSITPGEDYVLFSTKFGDFKLKRYMHMHYRNMPKFTLRPLVGDDKNPLSCKYDLTYIYGDSSKKLVIDFDCLKISELN